MFRRTYVCRVVMHKGRSCLAVGREIHTVPNLLLVMDEAKEDPVALNVKMHLSEKR